MDNKLPFDEDFPIKSEFLSTQDVHNFSPRKYSTHLREKRRLKLWILIALFLIFFCVIVFNALKILLWNQDNQKTSKNINHIDTITKITEVGDDQAKLVNEPTDQESDYWYYIKIPFIQVRFDELLQKNADTVAWIQVQNTNINYPIVQSSDNDYYLTHSFDKSLNEAGWIFMDFRNQADFSGKNTILYAHSRLDKTMFGSLSKVLKADWYKNKDNHIIRISTPTENTVWQIFSVYKIKEETYYITTDFVKEEDYLNFLNTLQSRSIFDFPTSLNKNDHILTLSTCYSDTERTVVHAKMIKRSNRDS